MSGLRIPTLPARIALRQSRLDRKILTLGELAGRASFILYVVINAIRLFSLTNMLQHGNVIVRLAFCETENLMT
jgi:hypothetical protein